MTASRNIDLKLLECFDVLIRESSVTVAAERLQMSQGNMSNSLARLRELLGDPLLVRTGSGMMPTQRALDLQDEVQDAVRQLRGLLEPVETEGIEAVHRHVRIACHDAAALFAVAPFIEELRQTAPNLTVELHQILSFRVKEPLDDGSLDVAIGAYLDLSDSLLVSRLLTGRMFCTVAANSRFAQGGMTIDDYCNGPHAVLSVAEGFRATAERITDQILADMGRERAVRLSSQFITVVANAVARSDLIATMPDYMIPQFAKNLPITAVDLPLAIPDYTIVAVWHPRSKNDWVLSWVRKKLREHFARAFTDVEGGLAAAKIVKAVGPDIGCPASNSFI